VLSRVREGSVGVRTFSHADRVEIATGSSSERAWATSPSVCSSKSFAIPGSVAPNWRANRIFTGPNTIIPTIQLANLGTNYNANWTPWNNKADDYQVRDDLSWARGAHQLKFGASWALYKKIQDAFAAPQGQFNFNGFYTGNDFADFLLGYPNNYQEDAVHDSGHWNNVSWGLYAQDNWRVNSRLTLNLGLRWDGVPHTYEVNHRASNFYPSLWDASKAATFDNSGNICSGPGNGCTATSPDSLMVTSRSRKR